MLVRGCPVVKNTFIEIPEQTEGNTIWRRQLSEPVEILKRECDYGDFDQDSKCIAPELFASDSENDDLSLHYSSAARFRANSDVAVLGRLAAPMLEDFDVNVDAEAVTNSPARQSASSADGPKSPEGRTVSSSRRNLNRLKDNDITKVPPPWSDITTVMMRNLPNRYTQQRLLDELREVGFLPHRHFNFFYLPMDHSNAANLGYCFINFTETGFANAFALAFQGKRMQRFKSNKTVVVMAASIQGYEKNYAYYSSTRIVLADDPQYRPLFFKHVGQVATSRGPTQAKPPPGKTSPKSDGNRGRRSKEPVAKTWGGSVEPPWSGDASDSASSWATNATTALSSAYTVPAVVCSSCGSDCGTGHRFCASCGSIIGQPVEQVWNSPMSSGVQGSMQPIMSRPFGDRPFGDRSVPKNRPAPGGRPGAYAEVWEQEHLTDGVYTWVPEGDGLDAVHTGDKMCGISGALHGLRVGSGAWLPQEAPYVF